MTFRQKYRCLVWLPIAICLALLAGGIASFLISESYPQLRIPHQDRISSHVIQGETEREALRKKFERNEITAAEFHRLVREASDAELARIMASRDKVNAAYEDRDRYFDLSLRFIGEGIMIAFLTAGLQSLLFAISLRLQAHLQTRGYDWITRQESAVLYIFIGNPSFDLPSADQILTLPGYSPDVESLIKYSRMHKAYKQRG